VVAHVYVNAASPAVWSEPSTDSVVNVPVTGEGFAAAGTATVGGRLTATLANVAVACGRW
jgi:hypothetical protein